MNIHQRITHELPQNMRAILGKYRDSEPIEHIDGVDICAIDEVDLNVMLGYISASLRIEERLKAEIELLFDTLSDRAATIELLTSKLDKANKEIQLLEESI